MPFTCLSKLMILVLKMYTLIDKTITRSKLVKLKAPAIRERETKNSPNLKFYKIELWFFSTMMQDKNMFQLKNSFTDSTTTYALLSLHSGLTGPHSTLFVCFMKREKKCRNRSNQLLPR